MTDTIVAEKLSKHYVLGLGSQVKYKTIRESMMHTAGAPVRWAKAIGKKKAPKRVEDLWALKDVSFKLSPGEVLGVVGRNGAGKSTLLKVLSRITQPTSGHAVLNGRVGSLLEVGTGFHPELTGRENVYLNGAILGMSRLEISRKFDEIVAFSEVERFLDTPVKRYSSGMYTRLAFAVASHLDPEILIVDEVLAVGDTQFQKKCIARMTEARRQGRTILFVSHHMAAVKSLCTRGLLMEGGRVAFDGDVDETVNRYLNAGMGAVRDGSIPDGFPRLCDVPGEARVTSARIMDLEGRPVSQLFFRQPFDVAVTIEVMRDIEDALLEISFSMPDGVQITYSAATDGGAEPVYLRKGTHEVKARFDTVLLPRDYSVNVGVHHNSNGATCDYVERCLDFSVLRVAESGSDHYHWPQTRGLVRAPAEWVVDGEVVNDASGRLTGAES